MKTRFLPNVQQYIDNLKKLTGFNVKTKFRNLDRLLFPMSNVTHPIKIYQNNSLYNAFILLILLNLALINGLDAIKLLVMGYIEYFGIFVDKVNVLGKYL